ncbi:MAG: YceI family protein [Caulobacteraceae bacterium]
MFRVPTLASLAILTLAACAKPSEAPKPSMAPAAPAASTASGDLGLGGIELAAKSDAPAGAYGIDKAHTSVNFRISHMGFSSYTARFTKIDATLNFDRANPAAMSVSATIATNSLQTNYPGTDVNFDAELTGANWLDAAKYPAITFKSTSVAVTGPNTAKVTGDLTLHGVTKPVTLDVTFNGGYAAMAMDPGGSRIGFSARGMIKRSDFGLAAGIPAPGTNMGVSDNIEVIIETEFTRPKDSVPAPAPAAN